MHLQIVKVFLEVCSSVLERKAMPKASLCGFSTTVSLKAVMIGKPWYSILKVMHQMLNYFIQVMIIFKAVTVMEIVPVYS